MTATATDRDLRPLTGADMLEAAEGMGPCRGGGATRTRSDGSGRSRVGGECDNKTCPACFARRWLPRHVAAAADRFRGVAIRRAILDELPPPPTDRCDVHRHRAPGAEAACVDEAWWAGLFDGDPAYLLYPLPDGRDLLVGNLRPDLGEPVDWVEAVPDAARRMAVGQDPETGLTYHVVSRGRTTRRVPPEAGEEPPEVPEPGDVCTPARGDPAELAARLTAVGFEDVVAAADDGTLSWGPVDDPDRWAELVEILGLRSMRRAQWEARLARRTYYEMCRAGPPDY